MLARRERGRPRLRALDGQQLEVHARRLRRVRRDHVAADHGKVELVARVRQVACRAAAVGRLRPAAVVLAAREVHVVVTRAARRARRPGRERVALRAVLVAGLAAADVARERHVGKIDDALPEADDLVRRAALDAREMLPAMNFVDHLREADAVAGIRVDLPSRLTGRKVGDLRRVTGHAEPHVATRAAVRLERIVAAVAGLRADDVAYGAELAPGGNEIVDGVRHVFDVVEGGVRVDRDPVRRVVIEARRQRGREGVPEETAAEILERAVHPVLRRRLRRAHVRDRARLDGRDVVAILAVGVEHGDHEAEIDAVRRQRCAALVGQEEPHRGSIVIHHRGVDDRDVELIRARAGTRRFRLVVATATAAVTRHEETCDGNDRQPSNSPRSERLRTRLPQHGAPPDSE